MKNKGDKEEEAEIRVEEETSEETGVKIRLKQEVENDKLEVARNLLLGAIVMEKILSLYMQSSQDRAFEIWPEAQSGDTAWDTGTAWDTARGYCLEESQDTAWDPARGYCLENSQDIDTA